MQNLKQESLKKFTSFHIGGPADIYLPENIVEFKGLLSQHPDFCILGGGTKILFPDEGLSVPVILTTHLKEIIEHDQEIKVQTGFRISRLFDFAAGISATAGGALYNNFGAFGYEIGQFVKSVRVISKQEDKWLTPREFSFSYRNSSLRQDKLIIAEVIFNKAHHKDSKKLLQERQQKQPLKSYSAGSVFKNPEGNYAGKLIEECGLKGYSKGDAVIWEKHANFIINKGKATCQDIKYLVKKMHQAVKDKFGINLELELEIYGKTKNEF